MAYDRAACVAVAIEDLIAMARDEEFHQHLEDLLREEFHDERRQGVADRGDDNL
jgi:hypothetical protein